VETGDTAAEMRVEMTLERVVSATRERASASVTVRRAKYRSARPSAILTMVGTRAADWFRQAEADLRHARHSLDHGDHEWACFAAQQAAEKAAKAAHEAAGREAWGHVVTELLDALRSQGSEVDEALLDRARALDKLYIPTRYPNGLAGGAPADFYTRAEAERAITDAEAILAVCRRMLPGK
jgi:HEPN domain-containing protein